jgi:hypothetical protein
MIFADIDFHHTKINLKSFRNFETHTGVFEIRNSFPEVAFKKKPGKIQHQHSVALLRDIDKQASQAIQGARPCIPMHHP